MVDVGFKSSESGAETFYATMGRCIAEWSKIDEALFRLCMECIGPSEQSAIVYYRLGGIDIRSGLVNELVESILPRKERKNGGHDHKDLVQWRSLVAEIKTLLGARRRIAHHPVSESRNALSIMSQFEYGGRIFTYLMSDPTGPWMHISTGKHERLRKSSSSEPLILTDLQKHLEDVQKLSGKLQKFHDVLITHGKASPAQNPLPTPSASEKDHHATKPRRRPRSSHP
jgi:hypothetical protein